MTEDSAIGHIDGPPTDKIDVIGTQESIVVRV